MSSNLFLIRLAVAFTVIFATKDHTRFKSDLYDYFDDYDYDDMDVDKVIDKYPGLFKTEEEMNKFFPQVTALDKKEVTRRLWESLSSSIWTVQSVKQSLTLSVSLSDASGTLYHGCCATNRSWANFTSLTDKDGNSVNVVQGTKRKQFFEVDTCIESPSCSDNCSCDLVNRYYSALIYNPKYPGKGEQKYKLDLVQAKTICRCINNIPPKPSKHKRDEF